MKNKLQEILNHPANKLIAVDLDGTLCEGEFEDRGYLHKLDVISLLKQ